MTESYDQAVFVSDEFSSYIHRRWFEAYEASGLSMSNATTFWDLVRPGEVDLDMLGGTIPATQAEVDEARGHYDALCRDAMRDRRTEEYAVPEYPGRADRRFEVEPEFEDE